MSKIKLLSIAIASTSLILVGCSVDSIKGDALNAVSDAEKSATSSLKSAGTDALKNNDITCGATSKMKDLNKNLDKVDAKGLDKKSFGSAGSLLGGADC